MELLEKIGPQVPGLVVLVYVVTLFLKSQKDTREANNIERKEMYDRMNLHHQEHLQARSDTRVVMQQVASAMHDMSMAVATCPLKKPV